MTVETDPVTVAAQAFFDLYPDAAEVTVRLRSDGTLVSSMVCDTPSSDGLEKVRNVIVVP